jgi:hypothetical protein
MIYSPDSTARGGDALNALLRGMLMFAGPEKIAAGWFAPQKLAGFQRPAHPPSVGLSRGGGQSAPSCAPATGRTVALVLVDQQPFSLDYAHQ